jgi:hypothetical protein
MTLSFLAERCTSPKILPLTPCQSVPPLQSVAVVHVAFALSVRARPLEFSGFEATYAFTFVAAR